MPNPFPMIEDAEPSMARQRDGTPGHDGHGSPETPTGHAPEGKAAPGSTQAHAPAEAAGMAAPPGEDAGQAAPAQEDADGPPAPAVPGWALAIAVLACAAVLFGIYQAFADNRCALRLGPTGYPYAYRLGHGCFVQVEGVWASEADWVQAPDGTWRRAPDLRRPQQD